MFLEYEKFKPAFDNLCSFHYYILLAMGENEIIEEIIESFKSFAIADIENNVQTRPIASFILCSCLIDQLAAFRYDKKFESKKYYKEFIKDYLPQYRALDLYVNLRCGLVHNYTVGKHIKLTNKSSIFDNLPTGKNVNVITAQMLFEDLKKAFEILCNEFRDLNSAGRKAAIARYHDSKILTAIPYSLRHTSITKVTS